MSVKNRVSEHRRRMREAGYRPIQVWVPDTRSENFTDEANRQSAIVAESDRRSDIYEWIDAVSVPWDAE
ncbi:antitoxin MazE family protein [Acaricomes phytoseiuli]|uniref:antitoxin MazE family protein n=1 Tax=Acaricomes phytoseiuli TaxID=291968 RepID=UPI000475C7BD|nr:antitoxin MazE family protein [Acaricomes phytoseiuli]